MSYPKPLIAFFGATGGCTLNALALTLKDGYPAIARTFSTGKIYKPSLTYN
jgi:hypothetical protein